MNECIGSYSTNCYTSFLRWRKASCFEFGVPLWKRNLQQSMEDEDTVNEFRRLIEEEEAVYEGVMNEFLEHNEDKTWSFEYAYFELSDVNIYDIEFDPNRTFFNLTNEIAQYMEFVNWVKQTNLSLNKSKCSNITFANAVCKFTEVCRQYHALTNAEHIELQELTKDVRNLKTALFQVQEENFGIKQQLSLIVQKLQVEKSSTHSSTLGTTAEAAADVPCGIFKLSENTKSNVPIIEDSHSSTLEEKKENNRKNNTTNVKKPQWKRVSFVDLPASPSSKENPPATSTTDVLYSHVAHHGLALSVMQHKVVSQIQTAKLQRQQIFPKTTQQNLNVVEKTNGHKERDECIDVENKENPSTDVVFRSVTSNEDQSTDVGNDQLENPIAILPSDATMNKATMEKTNYLDVDFVYPDDGN